MLSDDLVTLIPRLFAVTPADVQRIARQRLAPARAVIVVVGDRRTVEPQFAELGEVVVD